MTLYHLLTMTTGHEKDTFGPMLVPGVDRIKTFFEIPLKYEPGLHFLYNNGVPDILKYILERLTGESVFAYLRPRLFEPLKMSNYHADMNGNLEELPTMVFETRDLFKLAVLFAQGGVWENRRLLSEELVNQATRYQIPSKTGAGRDMDCDHLAGYCWQMWRNSIGGYRLDGGQGQYGIVVPEMDLVVAINASESPPMNILQVLWDTVTNSLYARPLTEDKAAQANLEARLAGLTWAPQNRAQPAVGWEGNYHLDTLLMERKMLTFARDEDGIRFSADGNGISIKADRCWHAGKVPFLVPELATILKEGPGAWTNFRHDLISGNDPSACLAAAAWTSPDTLEMHFRSDAWTGYHVFIFTFAKNSLSLSWMKGARYNMCGRDPKYIPGYLKDMAAQPPLTLNAKRMDE